MFAVSNATIFGQVKQPLTESIITNIRNELPVMLPDESGCNAVLAVVDEQYSLWEKAYGCLGGTNSKSVDEYTLFSIQSMTKSFTALGVLFAVQDGLVNLDTPIKEYLPDFMVNSLYDEHPESEITLRHLLSHWAGFTHEAPFGNNYDDRFDFTQHIKSISNTWLKYPVGYRYYYSNLGIDLAGYILQISYGKPYSVLMKENVLDRIGMVSSSFDMDLIESESNRAPGYAGKNDSPARIPMIPAGGLYSNLHDMKEYIQFHLNKGVVNGRRILRSDLMEQMHTIQFPHSRQRFGYCLGLIREPVSDSYGIYHAGGGYGFTSIMLMFPEKKLGVVLLTNIGDESSIWALRNTVKQTIVGKCGDTPIESTDDLCLTMLEPEEPRVQSVIGRYGDENGYVIKYENNVVGIQIGQNTFYPLTFYDHEGELVGLYGNFSEVRFLPDYHGKHGSMMLVDRRSSNHYFNIKDFNDCPSDPPGPDKADWSEFVGDYELLRNGQPIGDFSVTIRNGYLYAGENRCMEYKPGLFFTYEGEVIDFSGTTPSAMNIRIRKKK